MSDQRPLETADGSFTLHSDRYNQTYHSVHGARQESEHVFLEGSGVLDLLRSGPRSAPIRILEVGLGLGLNALVTAEAASRFKTAVEYTGIEHDFQRTSVIADVLSPFDPSAVRQFCSGVDRVVLTQARRSGNQAKDEQLNSGVDQTVTTPRSSGIDETMASHNSSASLIPEAVSLNAYVTLKILPVSLNAALSMDATSNGPVGLLPPRGFDAIYHDAFSPDANPECWNFDTLKKLGGLLVSGGNLATYCAKGSVRRDLIAAGLSVTRRPGPPGKRECLVATA